MLVDDLGLEFPEFSEAKMPLEGMEIDWEVPRTFGINRAWDLRPNVSKQLLNYKEDTNSYAETPVAHGANAEYRQGHPYHNGTDLHYAALCSGHNIREGTERDLFTFAVSFVCTKLVANDQKILGGQTGYVSIDIDVSAGNPIRIGEEGVRGDYSSSISVEVGKQYNVVWIFDRVMTIDGVNRHWLYINGKLDGKVVGVNASFDWFDASLMLGQRRGVSDGGNFFNGWIDYPVMWRRGLTETEAIAHTLNPTEIYKAK